MTAGNSRAARRIARGLIAGVMVLVAAACTTSTSELRIAWTALIPYKGARFTVSMPARRSRTATGTEPHRPLTFTILSVDQGDRTLPGDTLLAAAITRRLIAAAGGQLAWLGQLIGVVCSSCGRA